MDTSGVSSIGARVTMLRKAHGMKPAELSRQIGIKQPSLWEIENGHTKSLKGETLTKLCEVLHTTPDFLLREGGDEASQELEMMVAELAHTIRALKTPEARQELVDFARFLMGKQGASTASPFGKAVAGAGKAGKARRGVSVFGDLDDAEEKAS